jgi:hypothetical protein
MRSNIRWGTEDTNADHPFTFAVAGVVLMMMAIMGTYPMVVSQLPMLLK